MISLFDQYEQMEKDIHDNRFSIDTRNIENSQMSIKLINLINYEKKLVKKTVIFDNKLDETVNIDIEFPECQRWYWYVSRKGNIITEEIDSKWEEASKKGILDFDYMVKRPHFTMAPHSFNIAEVVYRLNISSLKKGLLDDELRGELEKAFNDLIKSKEDNNLVIKCTSVKNS